MCRDALGTGIGLRLNIDDAVNVVVPGVYDPTFCTCNLHLISSIGVNTYEVHAPEMAPAATSPAIDMSPDDGERRRFDDLKKSWALLYVKKRVAFSAIAPNSGEARPFG